MKMTVKEYAKARNQNYSTVIRYVMRHIDDNLHGHVQMVKHKYILDDEGIKILDHRSSRGLPIRSKSISDKRQKCVTDLSEIPTGYISLSDYANGSGKPLENVASIIRRRTDLFEGHTKIVRGKYNLSLTLIDKTAIKILDSWDKRPSGSLTMNEYAQSRGLAYSTVRNHRKKLGPSFDKNITTGFKKGHHYIVQEGIRILDAEFGFGDLNNPSDNVSDSLENNNNGKLITIKEYSESRDEKSSSVVMWVRRHLNEQLKGHVIRKSKYNRSYLLDEEAVRILENRKRKPREVFIEKKDGTLTFSEYAKSRSCEIGIITSYVKRHPELFDGHVEVYQKTPNCSIKILDEIAITFLDARYQKKQGKNAKPNSNYVNDIRITNLEREINLLRIRVQEMETLLKSSGH